MEITHFKRHRPREKNLYNQVDWELRTKNKNQEKRQKTGIIILVNLRPESYREREKIFSSEFNV